MLRLGNIVTLVPACMLLVLLSSCSNSPMSAGENAGNLTLSIKGLANATLAKGHLAVGGGDKVTLISARVVIEKIELENESDNSIDFKFNQPFVQDLLSIGTLQEIQTFQVPPGTYDKVKVSIDDLDVEDGDVFDQNPQLQNLSIRIEGYVNDDSAQVFVFTSDITLGITVDFSPPLVIDDTTSNKNIMIDLEYASWLVDDSRRFLDPSVVGNKERIERNIMNSLKVFKDDNRDGERDEDEFEFKAVIDTLGLDYLVLSGREVLVTADTRIVKDDGTALSFTDLSVGMCVKVHAVLQPDGSLVAIKIRVGDVKYDEKNDDHENEQVFEAVARIDSLGTDYLVVARAKISVNENTDILAESQGDYTRITFSDLQVGMMVVVRAVFVEDGRLLATKIKKVENEPESPTVVEIKAEIRSVGDNYIVIGDTRIFVDDETILRGEDHHDNADFTFADLQKGVLVELRAVLRDDGSLVATKIELTGQ